jgi:hypothetical protein
MRFIQYKNPATCGIVLVAASVDSILNHARSATDRAESAIESGDAELYEGWVSVAQYLLSKLETVN